MASCPFTEKVFTSLPWCRVVGKKPPCQRAPPHFLQLCKTTCLCSGQWNVDESAVCHSQTGLIKAAGLIVFAVCLSSSAGW